MPLIIAVQHQNVLVYHKKTTNFILTLKQKSKIRQVSQVGSRESFGLIILFREYHGVHHHRSQGLLAIWIH